MESDAALPTLATLLRTLGRIPPPRVRVALSAMAPYNGAVDWAPVALGQRPAAGDTFYSTMAEDAGCAWLAAIMLEPH